MTTFIRCYECGEFFEKKDKTCPTCATAARGVNVGLLGARWSSQLNAMKRDAIENT